MTIDHIDALRLQQQNDQLSEQDSRPTLHAEKTVMCAVDKAGGRMFSLCNPMSGTCFIQNA